jgi:hypothetical protein
LTQGEIYLVAGMAGVAVLITVADLVLSLMRHRSLARSNTVGDPVDRGRLDRGAVAVAPSAPPAGNEWVIRRLTAIQNSGKSTTTPPAAPDAT